MNILNETTNAISRGTDKISQLENLVSSKKQFLTKQIINVGLLFIILLVFGCLDFATLTLHFEKVLELSFWGTILTKLIAGMCAFNIGINIMYETELKKAENLEKAMNEYDILNGSKRNDFEHFIQNVYNPQEKRKAYKSKINKQIYLLNKYSRRYDRLLYSSELPERQEEKKTNKYCIKRKELEELKSDEYIDKNINSIIVKYNEVDASIFELDITGASTYTGARLVGNENLGRIKATSTMALGMVFFAMFTTSIGLEFSQQEFASQMERFWHYVLKCAEDVGVIMWQVIKGFGEPRKIISNELTKPYANRVKVLKEYWIWHKKQNVEDDEAYKKLHEEEIEISLDDLAKIQNEKQEQNA